MLQLLHPTQLGCPLPWPSAGHPPLTHTHGACSQAGMHRLMTDARTSVPHPGCGGAGPRASLVLTPAPASSRLGTPSPKKYFFILTVCVIFTMMINIKNIYHFKAQLGLLLDWVGEVKLEPQSSALKSSPIPVAPSHRLVWEASWVRSKRFSQRM